MIDTCSWDQPGTNPYSGSVPMAVYAYPEIPRKTADKLYARMVKHDFDDVAEITRDRIKGATEYTGLRRMHFGKKSVCLGGVSRSKWGTRTERGLVYCEDTHCIIVPTICKNVALVTKVPVLKALLPVPPSLPEVAQPLPRLHDLEGPGVVFLSGVPVAPSLEAAPSLYPVAYPLVSYARETYYVGLETARVPPVTPPRTVPEPSTWALVLVGLAGVLMAGSRER